MSRSKTHVPDRSIAQPGRRRKALDKNARRPRDWDVTTMMFSWVWYGCALSGSGESHRPETSVSSSDLMSTSCRHLICRASVPEEAVHRSGQRLMAMLVILERCYGRYS